MESTKFLNRQNILKMIFESALIIFSVLLALFLNEYRGQLKENHAKKQGLQMVKIELKANLEILNEWYPYHKKVFDNLGKVLESDSLQNSLLTKNGVNFRSIMPRGVVQRLVDNTSWQTFKASNVFTTIDFNTMFVLSKLYKLQSEGVEASLKNILVILSSRESMEADNLKGSIQLLRNAFNEMYSQEIFLIKKYEQAFAEIEIVNDVL